MAVLKKKIKKVIKKVASSATRRKGGKKTATLARNATHRVAGGKKRAIKKIIKKTSPLNLKRSNKNPIIEPESDLYWESKATFNPSAIYNDGKIHVIYRAIGNSDISVLGYAKSNDGYSFDKKLKEMAYYHKERKVVKVLDKKSVSKILYSSGGGWGGGCEDPRLTLLDDRVYMLYTSFDGWGSVRIALTSISLDDFINKRWNWKEPVLISPPGQIHKNWVLFPEKINGKYAILHSISPHIMINYFKSLDELDGSNFIHSVHQDSILWSMRDRLIRGVGPAPIKTKYGWLILYHKMERHDTHRYKLWAMILDTKNPTKILYNSKSPILEPDLWYENEGYKSGVVYSCGAVVKDGQLFVYYGGADKVSCVATADLDKFLKELTNSNILSLKKNKIKIKE